MPAGGEAAVILKGRQPERLTDWTRRCRPFYLLAVVSAPEKSEQPLIRLSKHVACHAEIFTGSPADFGKLLADETEKWAKVVKFAGVKHVDKGPGAARSSR